MLLWQAVSEWTWPWLLANRSLKVDPRSLSISLRHEPCLEGRNLPVSSKLTFVDPFTPYGLTPLGGSTRVQTCFPIESISNFMASSHLSESMFDIASPYVFGSLSN
ncbi:UNVERIFIED_CONTAM: hypothetical protein Slati_0932800 [Sesamum latifolium]|uniref:Uncharacterized protein n=1 Tax=Sesamum latifolium TaxID=2727402 RepID=A0AAW2XUD2_9LAMI